MYRSRNRKRQDRNNVIAGIACLVLAAVIAYYGFLGVECIRHFEELKRGNMTTINMGGIRR